MIPNVTQYYHLDLLWCLVAFVFPQKTQKGNGQREFCSKSPAQHGIFKGNLAYSNGGAVVFNAPLLGNDQAQRANTRILLKHYCGFFRHTNKNESAYDLHISQNFMSMTLRMKPRTFQKVQILVEKVLRATLLKLKLIYIDESSDYFFSMSQIS